jgi:hypothetical protein
VPAGASLSSQFADLDISEVQQAGYESFAAGGDVGAGAGSLISGGLAAAVFGTAAVGAVSEPLDGPGALLSRDLLGEIDGVAPGAAAAPTMLGLSDSADSLFAPAAPSPGQPSSASSSFSAFRSLW